MDVKLERIIPAPPAEVYDAWLDPAVPGTPWHDHVKLIVDTSVDGLWYWQIGNAHHYGRFIELGRPGKVQMSWMSKHTRGEETIVTVTFDASEAGTRLTLLHTGLPDESARQAHEAGWTAILEAFHGSFSDTTVAAASA